MFEWSRDHGRENPTVRLGKHDLPGGVVILVGGLGVHVKEIDPDSIDKLPNLRF